jgi:hypothetical protein
MAIQPIDLQTLYSQLDTVAKTAAHQQQGIQLAASMRAAEVNRQETEKNTAVQELAQENEGPQGINDRSSSGRQEKKEEKGKKKAPTPEKEQIFETIKDPNLGTYIDVLG